uniref:Alpha-macroglobulin-like TED domain-containing protein n=1 Tax=Otolemur garnettii TaxID=30611 RepID=H0XT36_OTOGA
KYTFIDENVQKQTLIWLSSKQKSNGCFENDGELFNDAWKSGDEEGILLMALTVGAFFEAGLNFTFPALRNGLFCLEEALASGVTNAYNQAILAYVLALAGKEKQVEVLLQTLDQSATKINNVIYWEGESKPKTEESPPFIPHVPSVEQEKTCYVLLAVISREIPDLTYASVQWVAQQMNFNGGFSSTQGTEVYFLAVTRYMKLTFSNDQNTVTFSSKRGNEIFQINSDNRLLVQGSELTKAYGQYTVDVEGQGCAFIQEKKCASIIYENVLSPKKESAFSLSLEVVKDNTSDRSLTKFGLTVT